MRCSLVAVLLAATACAPSDPFDAAPPGSPTGNREMRAHVLQAALDNLFDEDELEGKRVICIGVAPEERIRGGDREERKARSDPATGLLDRLEGPLPLAPRSHCERDSNLAQRHIASGERAMVLALGRFRMTASDRTEVGLSILDDYHRRRTGTCELVERYGEWVINSCSASLGG